MTWPMCHENSHPWQRYSRYHESSCFDVSIPVQSTATFLRENQDALFPHPSSSTPWILALTVGEFHRLLPKKACWDLCLPCLQGQNRKWEHADEQAVAMKPSSGRASQEPSQQEKFPILPPRQPACCLRGVGPVPSRSVPSGSFSAPHPTPLSKGLMQKGAIWPFVDTFSLGTVPSWCECGTQCPRVSCPSPPSLSPSPHQPRGEV